MAGRGGRTCSSALVEAQEQLQQLRRQYRASQDAIPPGNVPHGRYPEPPSLIDAGLPLPDHLGWNSTDLSAAVRAARDRRSEDAARKVARSLTWLPKVGPSPSPPDSCLASSCAEDIKLYPDIALGLLREEEVAAGRIWLLLRHLDRRGRGWVEMGEARTQLTKKDAILRVCGWRQMRKLLARGEGLFWERTKGRLWLRSVARVAAALGIFRLVGQPVALPVQTLLQPIGMVRAHFYASFHSSRTIQSSRVKEARPIARATLRQLCRVSRHTQRSYEVRATVHRRFNFAIGTKYTPLEAQERAWKHGAALFHFTDDAGRFGNKGSAYTAWQLPNDYIGPHRQRPKGQQKRINRVLADLFMKGMTGNDKQPIQDTATPRRRRFYGNGSSAAASYNRSPDQDVYWPEQREPRNSFHIWHLIPGQASES